MVISVTKLDIILYYGANPSEDLINTLLKIN